jgi:hypothetical protein
VGIGLGHAQALGRAGHKDQVHMVGHKAPGPHRNAHLRATLGELVATGGMIIVGEEGLPPTVAAPRDGVEDVWTTTRATRAMARRRRRRLRVN